MSTRSSDVRAHELPALARARDVDGTLVTARCFLIEGPTHRYEIILSNGDDLAIVDVPISEHRTLAHFVEQALESFIAGHSMTSD